MARRLMRLLDGERPRYAVSEGEGAHWLEGSFGRWRRGGPVEGLEGFPLFVPCEPTKIVALARNYSGHAEEMGKPLPDEPIIFLKPPSALLAHGGKIALPRLAQRVDYEGELAVVIGRRAKGVRPTEAGDYILGLTCANDVTARDLQKMDAQWTRGKGFDTFCPLGPYLAMDLAPGDLLLRTWLNGELRQEARTREMVFDVGEILAYISAVMTLEPGDVILTGTPKGVGQLKPGDVVEVEIEGIGALRNSVVREGSGED
ncbi:MAG TPA: 2-hydroxyhepta-2,4-diene-1,7-dioate isomerase [Chloroflexi bacterium]|nr:2-hydroxyhepta-2,4-diene-1,7-dioate isomerase [Chloroflexota bacterium]